MSRSPSVAESSWPSARRHPGATVVQVSCSPSSSRPQVLEDLRAHQVRVVHAGELAKHGVEPVEVLTRARVVTGHQRGHHHAVTVPLGHGEGSAGGPGPSLGRDEETAATSDQIPCLPLVVIGLDRRVERRLSAGWLDDAVGVLHGTTAEWAERRQRRARAHIGRCAPVGLPAIGTSCVRARRTAGAAAAGDAAAGPALAAAAGRPTGATATASAGAPAPTSSGGASTGAAPAAAIAPAAQQSQR